MSKRTWRYEYGILKTRDHSRKDRLDNKSGVGKNDIFQEVVPVGQWTNGPPFSKGEEIGLPKITLQNLPVAAAAKTQNSNTVQTGDGSGEAGGSEEVNDEQGGEVIQVSVPEKHLYTSLKKLKKMHATRRLIRQM